ncbi:Fis family transcriptional regulator [Burkholderia sp. 8Y]|uniref:sigma-54-dependent Fis family transcriptional regulator n=1 Tax=Burkholderia sp. 8Y TaxID=2653133 RepID=UPI0012F24571|nr:helix-turn-helix domain-containing protein [Burkholderia sp. 8Y]VXC92767.1 Fis family transcriptional regulator [Burkholderia sp. 8Y]
MPYVPQTRHIERVRHAIEARGLRPGDGASARLVSSYRRSLEEHHLDPGATVGPRILTSPELRDIRHREEPVLRASGQCLSQLHEMVREADYCVMLTDAAGVAIDYRVDPDRRNAFKRAGLYPGSCWSEREEGTCGIASVLLDREPITVHKFEHFRAAFTTLTCSAAPIFGLSGELIGVLDASAVRSPDERESQRLVNHIVRQSAILIENSYFLHATTNRWVMLAHRNRHYVETQPEILIAFDERGRAVAANRRAKECVPGLDRLPCDGSELFNTRALRLLDARMGSDAITVRLASSGEPLFARVRQPVLDARHPQSTPVVAPSADKAAIDEAGMAERRRIVNALTTAKWRPIEAAKLLGMSRATLYRRIAKHNIVAPHRR